MNINRDILYIIIRNDVNDIVYNGNMIKFSVTINKITDETMTNITIYKYTFIE